MLIQTRPQMQSYVFNANGEDDPTQRKIWYGETTNLIQFDRVGFPWATAIYRTMRENFWIPQRVNLTDDVNHFVDLSPAEKKAFRGIFSYLIFLDSLQVANIPHVKNPITAPEVSICLAEQASQEAMHSESYQTVIETVLPPEEQPIIYDYWRNDPVLLERCRHIAGIYQSYVEDPTPENYFVTLIGDLVLEGLYFYPGFIYFYHLAASGKMPRTAEIIRLINRDEYTHVWLITNLIREGMKYFPHSQEQIYELFSEATEQEIAWVASSIGDDIPGLSLINNECYIKYLANLRLKSIGLEPLYRGIKNPYAHLEKQADSKDDAMVRSNFFETNVASYNMDTAIPGWHKINNYDLTGL